MYINDIIKGMKGHINRIARERFGSVVRIDDKNLIIGKKL